MRHRYLWRAPVNSLTAFPPWSFCCDRLQILSRKQTGQCESMRERCDRAWRGAASTWCRDFHLCSALLRPTTSQTTTTLTQRALTSCQTEGKCLLTSTLANLTDATKRGTPRVCVEPTHTKRPGGKRSRGALAGCKLLKSGTRKIAIFLCGATVQSRGTRTYLLPSFFK